MQIFYCFAVAPQPSWTGGVDIKTSLDGAPCFIMAEANLSVMSKITKGAGACSLSAYNHDLACQVWDYESFICHENNNEVEWINTF